MCAALVLIRCHPLKYPPFGTFVFVNMSRGNERAGRSRWKACTCKKIRRKEHCGPRKCHLSVGAVNLLFTSRNNGIKAMYLVTIANIYLLRFSPGLYLPKVNSLKHLQTISKQALRWRSLSDFFLKQKDHNCVLPMWYTGVSDGQG